jgi:hypothetical protein
VIFYLFLLGSLMNFELTSKKTFAIFLSLLFLNIPVQSQIMVNPETEFTSSNLPIIFIDTDGMEIEDALRIPANMGIIFNGQDNRNNITDPFNNYDGHIAIETRGSMAQSFPKKSYRFETQDSLGNDENASLLGMPSENDWILYAPFIDLSMIRNVLAYGISNDIGRYASRTHFCELILNDEYQGVYVLMEKIKRDNDRVDIARTDENDIAGDSLTGGYIIKLDKKSGENVGWWISEFGTEFQYDYPKPDRIVIEQKEYIKNFMDDFESVVQSNKFTDPNSGYSSYIDIGSFVDHFILNELFRNIDAYRISAFLHKHCDSDGGKLNAGPVWDFNLSAGMAFFSADAGVTEGWVVDYNKDHPFDSWLVPFWWEKIAHESNFQAQASQRWFELRQSILDIDELMTRIDCLFLMLNESRVRNWLKWNDQILDFLRPYDPSCFEQDSTLLKQWFPERIAWLDEQFEAASTSVSDEIFHNKPGQFNLRQNYPNPFNPSTTISYSVGANGHSPLHHIDLSIYNILGQKVATLVNKTQSAGSYQVEWNASGFASGVYLFRLETDKGFEQTKKMILVK